MTTIETLKAEVKRLEEAMTAHTKMYGQGFNPHTAKHEEAVMALVAAVQQDVIDNFDDYRARWNAAVAKHGNNIRKIEAEVGCSIHMIRAAKAAKGE